MSHIPPIWLEVLRNLWLMPSTVRLTNPFSVIRTINHNLESVTFITKVPCKCYTHNYMTVNSSKCSMFYPLNFRFAENEFFITKLDYGV